MLPRTGEPRPHEAAGASTRLAQLRRTAAGPSARQCGPTLSPSCRPASWLTIRAPKRHQRAGEPVPGVAATHGALFRVMGTPRPGMSLSAPTARFPASRAPNSLQEGLCAGEPALGFSCEPPRRAGRSHPSRRAGASCTPSKPTHSPSKLAVRARLRWPPTTVRGDGESHPGSFGLHPNKLGEADASRSSMISWSSIGRLASQSSSRTPIWSSFMSSLPVAPFDWRTSRTSPPQNSEPIRRSARVFRRRAASSRRTSQAVSSRARRPRPQGFSSCEGPYPPSGMLHPNDGPKPS